MSHFLFIVDALEQIVELQTAYKQQQQREEQPAPPAAVTA